MDDATKQRLSVSEAAKYSGYSRSRIYWLIEHRYLAHHKPANGKVFILLTDLEAFLNTGRVATSQELSNAAETLLTTKRSMNARQMASRSRR